VIIFNSIASNILKWLRFKLLRWIHYLHQSALLNDGLGLLSVVSFPWLHHIPSIADVTMETKVYTSEVDAIPAPFSVAQH
jgi:hypothetical protein